MSAGKRLLYVGSRRSLDRGKLPLWVCAVKGGAFQWVQVPPGKMLQPEATGAVMEVTKWLKPSV
jgi:hypothetical protein